MAVFYLFQSARETACFHGNGPRAERTACESRRTHKTFRESYIPYAHCSERGKHGLRYDEDVCTSKDSLTSRAQDDVLICIRSCRARVYQVARVCFFFFFLCTENADVIVYWRSRQLHAAFYCKLSFAELLLFSRSRASGWSCIYLFFATIKKYLNNG